MAEVMSAYLSLSLRGWTLAELRFFGRWGSPRCPHAARLLTVTPQPHNHPHTHPLAHSSSQTRKNFLPQWLMAEKAEKSGSRHGPKSVRLSVPRTML